LPVILGSPLRDNAGLSQARWGGRAEDTFAKFACEPVGQHATIDSFSRIKRMSAMDKEKSWPTLCFRNGLYGIFWALAQFSTGFAAEPATSVAYKSAFTGYRFYEAQASSVDWRQANETVREAVDGAPHAMHAAHESEAGADSEHAADHKAPTPPQTTTVPQEQDHADTQPDSTSPHEGRHK
jgi:hypothetical protein